jgi:hypothetical protein
MAEKEVGTYIAFLFLVGNAYCTICTHSCANVGKIQIMHLKMASATSEVGTLFFLLLLKCQMRNYMGFAGLERCCILTMWE